MVRFTMRILLLVALLAGCTTGPKTVPMPPLPARTERVETVAAIDGFGVEVMAYGASGWRVTVKNDSDAPASVLWDESHFATQGKSLGRLIGLEAQRMGTIKTQLPTPVPAHGSVSQVVFVEKMMAGDDVEDRHAQHAAAYGRSEEHTSE